MVVCLDFQEEISKRENDRASVLLEEKQVLENEIDDLNKKNNALKNSMMAFMEDIVEDLQGSISGNASFFFLSFCATRFYSFFFLFLIC